MDLTLDPAAEFSSELQPGEKILWAGMPDPKTLLTASDSYLIPFSLFWAGFAFFWEFMALTATQKAGSVGVIFPIFGLPFVGVGLYLLFGRFWVAKQVRQATYYAVTANRLIWITNWPSRKVVTLPLTPGMRIEKTVRRDGRGTLAFGDAPAIAASAWGGSSGYSRNNRFPTGALAPNTFVDIADPDEVQRIVETAYRPQDKPAAP